ncbi:MAG TPA: phytanoyl-CoA dioxygenase family protein [Sandaracinaceae bacterium LLY-WYZ-13_1]|nr:phytanoyl-CoA dioxygenase family protein [Sandaracinaceae bacterium LLY-WYZ-13_1]
MLDPSAETAPRGSAEARDLRERGYAVFPDLLDAARVRVLREAVEELVAVAAPDAFYAPDTRPVTDRVAITPTGVAHDRLLSARPDLRPTVLPERLLAPLREVLGGDLRVELVGAVISDHTRPFFRWHTHIGGVEEGERNRRGAWPAVEGVHRVLTLLYLDDLDDESGPLLVLPRRVGDPTAPPHPLDEPRWPGAVELRPRAGTLVALEQCTWHAAYSRRSPGHRRLIGGYFGAADTPVPDWADPTLAGSA